ncbi:MAG: MBOAT family protein, partial [Hyphomicrobiaceae bacterium]|nr:MBOAT family protein [Hyphomicrobiaceae bacterium]
WLRDYLYIPLGGSQGRRLRTYRNLLVTMLLGGIWHGAAWKFVIWGAMHGGALALERAHFARVGLTPHAAAERRPIWRRAIAVLVTFHFVCLAWIFFRAEDLERAIALIAGLARWQSPVELVTPFLAGLIAFGLAIQFTPSSLLQKLDWLYQKLPVWLVGLLAGATLVLIEAVGGDGSAPFIYFQF